MAAIEDYVEVVSTNEILAAADSKLAKFNFDASRGLSKFGSERNRTLIGYLGERMVMDVLALREERDDFDFDLSFREKRLEVKSISCKFRPPSHFLCTVNSHDLSGVHKQEADYYVFVRILNDKSRGWILGYLPCHEFFKKGTFVPKGSSVAKGIEFVKANATVLEISALYPIQKLLQTGPI
jgi:hypothetical protein